MRFQFRRTAKLHSIDEAVPLLRLQPLLLGNWQRCHDQKTRVVRKARAATQNAASVAALLITTEAMIAELQKNRWHVPGGGMGGMDL